MRIDLLNHHIQEGAKQLPKKDINAVEQFVREVIAGNMEDNFIDCKLFIMKNELVEYIRDAKIFNLRQLELAAGIPPGTLSKAISGARPLPENAARKIMHVFTVCGVKPIQSFQQ